MSTKKSERDEKRQELKAYRAKQRELAFIRDEGMCQYCLHELHKNIKAGELHHVLGRGNNNTKEIYEHYSVLMCLCAPCHRKVTKNIISDEKIVEILKIINDAEKETHNKATNPQLRWATRP